MTEPLHEKSVETQHTSWKTKVTEVASSREKSKSKEKNNNFVSSHRTFFDELNDECPYDDWRICQRDNCEEHLRQEDSVVQI